MPLKDLYKKGQLENINVEKTHLKKLKKELNRWRLKVLIVSPTKAGSYDSAEELIGTKFKKYRPTIKIQIQYHFVVHLINKVPWNIEIQRNQIDFNHGCNTESWIDNLKLTPLHHINYHQINVLVICVCTLIQS